LLLGGIKTSGNQTIGAEATKMTYFLKNQAEFVKSEGKRV